MTPRVHGKIVTSYELAFRHVNRRQFLPLAASFLLVCRSLRAPVFLCEVVDLRNREGLSKYAVLLIAPTFSELVGILLGRHGVVCVKTSLGGLPLTRLGSKVSHQTDDQVKLHKAMA